MPVAPESGHPLDEDEREELALLRAEKEELSRNLTDCQRDYAVLSHRYET